MHRVKHETIHKRVRILKVVVQEVNGSIFKPKPKNNSNNMKTLKRFLPYLRSRHQPSPTNGRPVPMSTTPTTVDGRNTPIVVSHSFFYVCTLLQSQPHFQTRATTSSPKVMTSLASWPARSTGDGFKRYQVADHHDTPNVPLPSSASHIRSGTRAVVLYCCALNYAAPLSPSLFELRLVDGIVADNFLFFSALPFCVKRM